MLSQTPDSLLTKSQLVKKIAIYTIAKEYTFIDGEKWYTTATVDDFEKEGLPEDYYHYYLKGIEELNSNADYSPLGIQEVYDNFIQDLENQLEKLSEDI